ncbi:MAG: sigma-70 family RNA polymerase sigma factor [Bacteroidota bacterium]
MLRPLRRPRAARAVPSSNEDWLAALGDDRRRDAALAALRPILVRGLRAALVRRVPAQANALAEDFAQEALLQILAKRETFRGDARFTTWAQKIAVRLALSELRRKRWENVSFEDLLPDGSRADDRLGAFADDAPDPERSTEQQQLVDEVVSAIEETLTERQRTALQLLVFHGVPMDVAAERLGTNRNALYKLVHDARKKLRTELAHRGIPLEELGDV